jgi:hypothetical protein
MNLKATSAGVTMAFYTLLPDKYYGPKNTIKDFVNACHQNGIAVIMDIVLNHTYGPSPLKDMYGLANNPWYNPRHHMLPSISAMTLTMKAPTRNTFLTGYCSTG